MSPAQITNRSDPSLDLALALVDGIRAEAARRGKALAVAVVDSGGAVVLTARMDGAQHPAVQIATDKAWTASAFGRPTEAWAASTAPGGADWGLTVSCAGRLVVFAGGLPLHADGVLIGGLGVSGAAADIDRSCAEAGLRALGLPIAP